MVNLLTNTIRQEQAPSALFGRVQGIVTAQSFTTIPVGRGIAATLIDPIGVPALLLSIGIFFALATAVLLVLPVFRNLNAADAVG